MTADEIREFCLGFPYVTEKLQWGDALCLKVAGKIFAILELDHVRLTFKCTPDSFAELIEREEFRPAPYVGRHNWVMLERLNALRNDELRDFIGQSYEIIASKTGAKKAGEKTLRKTKKRRVRRKSVR